MSGALSSLGIGSGVLTATVIDQLKAADTANIITPIDNKITLNNQKSQALDLLSSLLTSYKSSVSGLGDDTLFQGRTVSGSNDYASVTSVAGSQIQDFSLNVTNIAKKSVLESSSYTSTTAPIATGSGTLNLGIGGKNYSISYTASTTLSDLKQAINDAAGSSVTASTLQTGTSKYNLVLTSNTTGQNQTISLSDVSGNLSGTNLLTKNTKSGSFLAADDFVAATGSSGTMTLNVGGTTANFAYTGTTKLQGMADMINADSTMSTKVSASIVQYGTNDFRMVLTPKSADVASSISMSDSAGGGLSTKLTFGASVSAGSMGIIQDGTDANFTFNGISMTRSTNTITDIASGMTVNLLKDGGSANISITQDLSNVKTSMQTMVSSYNTLISQISDMTAYDATAGKVGIFNGDSTIKNISREITRMVTSVDSKGYALPNYGINLDEKTGQMSFDQNAFNTKINADPAGTEAFFSGKTTVTSTGNTKTGSFASSSTLISSGASGTMGISIGSTPYSFAYSGTTTLQQMADGINADSTINTNLTASIVQYGTSDYRMVLTPKSQAVGEKINITDSVGGGLLAAMKSTVTTSDVVTTTDGIFTSLNSLLNSYTSSTTGLVTNLTQAAKDTTTTLTADRVKANALLTARYDTMTTKFAAYDSMISKMNAAFASLKQQIAQSTSSSSG
jgi:flagellar hook-associated protein 2